jgi:hypothetical protein
VIDDRVCRRLWNCFATLRAEHRVRAHRHATRYTTTSYLRL